MPNRDYYEGVQPQSWGDTWENFATIIGGGAQNGYGLGDAASGMAGNAGMVEAGKNMGRRIARGAQDAVLGEYPGYGELWGYDAAQGVQVTPLGWAAVAVVVIGAWMVLK